MPMLDILKPRPKTGEEVLPSILEQTNWECGFYEFPGKTPDVEYFNCGIVDWEMRRWLVARQRRVKERTAGQNRIVLWQLENNNPTHMFTPRILEKYIGEHQEDPRAIVRDGALIVSYCNFRKISWAHQCIIPFDRTLSSNPIHISYGKNGRHLMDNTGHEKNWVWFTHDGKLHFVYMTMPHIVCRTEGGEVTQEYTTQKMILKWRFGHPRGGSPPVRVGDHYFAFFHSSMPNSRFRARYYMGAYCFKAEPPFEIVSMTASALLGGSEFDRRDLACPLVVFPCGAIYENDTWLISMGVNDTACAWIRMPHKDLLKRMEGVK